MFPQTSKSHVQLPVRFGLIGAGNIATLHAAALASIPAARLYGVASPRLERARALAEPHGATAFTDVGALLADPQIDAVIICTPSGTHCEIGLAAAAAGKHVVVEKPIDVSLEKARALIASCQTAGVHLGVIFQSRFLPAVALIRKALAAGRLGRLFMADAYVKWSRDAAYYAAAPWRGTCALDGGGALINQAIHSVDLIAHFAGPVDEVFGRTARLRHTQIECEDTAVATLRFRSGALGVVQATTSLIPGVARRVELHGERGTIILEGNDISVWRLDGHGPEEDELEALRTRPRDTSDGASNPMNLDIAGHRAQLENFVNAIAQGLAPAVDGQQALIALEIVLGIYQSAKLGLPVTLPL